jgi:hypothetical protein
LENEEAKRSPLDYDKRETLGWVAMAETSDAVAAASGFMHTQLLACH